MTLVSISGASSLDLSTPTAPIIYAGFAGSCAGDGINTCDSCTGAVKSGMTIWPCNKKNAYPSLVLNIRVQTTTVGANTTNATIKIGGKEYTPTIPLAFADGILTVQLTWSEICNSPEVNKGAQCEGGSFPADLDIGFSVTANGTTATDSLSFKLRTRVAATDGSDWFYPDCANTSTPNTGACHFTVFPGDGKIYADNFSVADGYPTAAAAGIEYTDVVFFYEMEATSGESDSSIISRITNKSPTFSLGVNKAASPPLADNRINGLTNGVRYCMAMANQDASGIISFFTPIPVAGLPGGVTPVSPTDLCTTPTPVVGLLDDKHCFIATAAFGTDMAPEVQSFRAFRNKFLLPHPWGKSFVKFYYKHSPFYANLIAESEVTKFIVRSALWPLLLFARLSVSLGFWASFLLMTFAVLFLCALLRNGFLKKRFRGGMFVIIAITFLIQYARAQEVESAPKEPPFVQEENEFDTPVNKQQEAPLNIQDEVQDATEPEEERPVEEEQTVVKEPSVGSESERSQQPRVARQPRKGGVEYIEHPLAAKGLTAITKDGAYIYKTKKIEEKNNSGIVRLGMMDPPKIVATDGATFESMYSKGQQSIFMFDYEWHPFSGYGKLGVQAGVGLLMAYGNGRFATTGPLTNTPAKEKYTFVAIPLSLGVIYRLEWLNRQWLAPYVAGGGVYIPVAEIRDDGKSPNTVGTPGAYGSAGMLFNISAMNRDTAFNLSSEYGITNLWVSVDYRYLKTFNEALDFSSNIFGGGIVIDY